MFQPDVNVVCKYGICSVDNGSCCGSDSVCRLKPEFGSAFEWSMDAHKNVVLLNKFCSNYFATGSALECSRETSRLCVDSPYLLANRISSKSLGADSGMLNAAFVVKSKSSEGLDAVVLSPPANFDALGGKYGDIEIVGHGKATNERCGHFRNLMGCLHTELHHNSLDGVDRSGKVFVRIVHTWCHNPRCPVCYKHGYAVREAKNATEHIKEANKKHDSPAEHIIISPPISEYGLSYEKLHAKARSIARLNGIAGGALIFHGFRFNNQRKADRLGVPFGWVWSPHFHVVGYILGGYSHCRNCEKVKDSQFGKPSKEICAGCSGFESQVRKNNEVNGYIVKVKGERKTIMGTFWYQLHHASLDVSKKRFHCLTWFGTCSYSKLKIVPHKHVDLCPVCKHELVKVRYFGSQVINTDFKSSLFKRELWMDEFEDGKPVFAVLDDGFNGKG